MAQPISSGYLGDATGGIGQGLAYVLPEGKADAYAMQLAQTHGNQLQEMARQKVLQQQASQKQYETDFRNAELPKVWGPFADEINKRHSDLLAEAGSDWAKTGKSPWSTSDFTNKYNEQVTGLAAKANQFGEELTKRLAASRADKDGKLSEDSKNALDDFYKGFLASKDKTSYLDKDMPDLKDRDFTVDDVVKTLKTVPKTVDDGDNRITSADTQAHANQAYSTVMGDPKYAPLLMKYAIHPGGPDTTAYVYDKDANGKNINSSGKRVFPTDPAYADYMAKEWMADPNKEKDLATIGISKHDPYAEQKIAHYITDRNANLGKLVNDIATAKDADVPTKNEYTGKQTAEKDREFSEQLAVKRLGIEYQNLSLAKQREAREASKQHADNIIDDIYNYNTNPDVAKEKLGAISTLYETNPTYGAKLHYHDDGNNLTVTIPGKRTHNQLFDATSDITPTNQPYIVTPPQTLTASRSNPEQFRALLYGVMKNVGSPGNISKFTQSGKQVPAKKTDQQQNDITPVAGKYY